LGSFFKSKKIVENLLFSLAINVVIAPLIMTALAWATLPDLPHHRTGVILVGVARCIAMVLIWSNLAGGDMEWCAILVAVNSIVQLVLFSPVAYFLCVIVGKGDNVTVDFWLVTRSVLIFLGIPLAAGIITRFTLRFGLKKWFGPEWYDKKFIPVIGTTSLIGLLFTIVVMFTLQVSYISRFFFLDKGFGVIFLPPILTFVS
jgi:ACR3 family arsenite transporter